jgi:hypothetical protein
VVGVPACRSVLLWTWDIGDLWPSVPQGDAVPPCLPDIDHHLPPLVHRPQLDLPTSGRELAWRCADDHADGGG